MKAYNDFLYEDLDDGSIEIKLYQGYDGQVVVPSTIDGVGVAKIGHAAFFGCDKLEQVEIPEGIEQLGDLAFDACENLKVIYIPASIKSIGKKAFKECNSLKEIRISSLESWCNIDFANSESSPLYYGGEIYVDGKALSTLSIPPTVRQIKPYAFFASKLIEAKFHDGIVSIGERAFGFCHNLKRIELPSSVENIHCEAFVSCDNLDSIEVSQSNPKYYDNGNCLIDRSTGELVLGCKNSTIPSEVTTIGESAFFGCKGLTNIVIPNGVKYIERYAFLFCKNLARVTIPNTLVYISDDAFNTNGNEIDVYIDDIAGWCNINICGQFSNPLHYGGKLYCDGKEVTSLIVPDGIKEISGFAFYSCSSIKDVHIPSSVTKIGRYAFSYCTNLQDVSIADGEIEIEEFAFADSSLVSITLPNGLKTISNDTFARCSNLTSLTIPDSVECIQDFAFAACEKLTELIIPAGVNQIEKDAFHMLDAKIIYRDK